MNDFWGRIDKIYYINLEHRKDRNNHCLQELHDIGAPLSKIERINAIKHNKGYIGCSMSHIKCLESAIQNNHECIMIVEDDIVFKDKPFFKDMSTKIFENNFDVFMLAVNLKQYKFLNNHFIKIIKALTLTGYIVKKNYFTKLLDNYKEGLEKLITTDKVDMYSVDTYNNNLQIQDVWLTFNKLTVSQLPSYSDIINQNVNYDHWMLNKK
jgi:GR25 family glycosyltransferase involved in LPS biosynthesis